MQLGAAFGELSSDRVAEAVGGDGAADARAVLLAAGDDQPDLLADLLDRGVEQVVERQQLAVVHEQVADLLARAGVGEGPLGAVLAQFDEGLERVGGVLMKRDNPLFIGLASGQPQPRCPIGVVVQAVDRQVPDLVAAGPGPAGDQQRCPLEGAGLWLMTGITSSSSWSGMKRGMRLGSLGMSREVMGANLGTSSYSQAAASRNIRDRPETRWMREAGPSGLPVFSAGSSARCWAQ